MRPVLQHCCKLSWFAILTCNLFCNIAAKWFEKFYHLRIKPVFAAISHVVAGPGCENLLQKVKSSSTFYNIFSQPVTTVPNLFEDSRGRQVVRRATLLFCTVNGVEEWKFALVSMTGCIAWTPHPPPPPRPPPRKERKIHGSALLTYAFIRNWGQSAAPGGSGFNGAQFEHMYSYYILLGKNILLSLISESNARSHLHGSILNR